LIRLRCASTQLVPMQLRSLLDFFSNSIGRKPRRRGLPLWFLDLPSGFYIACFLGSGRQRSFESPREAARWVSVAQPSGFRAVLDVQQLFTEPSAQQDVHSMRYVRDAGIGCRRRR
jgi:hypothetical protein